MMSELSPNVFFKSEDYTVYQMGNNDVGVFFACVPNELKKSISIYVDLNKKSDLDLFKDLGDPQRKQELITKLNEVNKMVNGLNKSGIYAMPLIDVNLLENKLDDNAKLADYQKVFKMITNCTMEISKNLNNVNNGERTIEQAIKIIEEKETDKLFIAWLKEQYPNFVDGVTLDDLRRQYEVELQMMGEVLHESHNEAINSSPLVSSENLTDKEIIDKARENVVNKVGNENINNMQNTQVIPTPIIAQSIEQPVNQTISQPINQPINQVQSNGIAPVDHSLDEAAYQEQRNMGMTKTLVHKKPGGLSRTGFVKFPVFLLTIMAIGSLGVFIGKMFYLYLSKQG